MKRLTTLAGIALLAGAAIGCGNNEAKFVAQLSEQYASKQENTEL